MKNLKKKFKKHTYTNVKLFKVRETLLDIKRRNRLKKLWMFIKAFLLNFLEHFLQKKIIFCLRKCSKLVDLHTMSSRQFNNNYFKRNLRIPKQILGIIYYSFLLKDASILSTYIKRILEKINIKLHKSFFLGLRKIVKTVFKPVFKLLGLLGLFFNVKGKIGVSGNAKKRRYFFYFGKHSLTTRTLRVDLKFTQIWTFTGVMGLTFYLFF